MRDRFSGFIRSMTKFARYLCRLKSAQEAAELDRVRLEHRFDFYSFCFAQFQVVVARSLKLERLKANSQLQLQLNEQLEALCLKASRYREHSLLVRFGFAPWIRFVAVLRCTLLMMPLS